MFQAIDSPYLVRPETFRVADAATEAPGERLEKKQAKKLLEEEVERIAEAQRRLYASDRHSLLLVFQAMDAAGKDGTIRAVTSGVNPAGFQVHSFKKPSSEELDHDFLWRTAKRLPERGRIGVFNRSYYEEVLVVRVHPAILAGQQLPDSHRHDEIWTHRFESIRDHELHLARNGTVILKFWLNVSWDEQRSRFLKRIEEPEKHWKFAAGDVRERGHWGEYMQAYEEALIATSRPWAPWYAIPADDKPTMRWIVARLVAETLDRLDPRYPVLSEEEKAEMARLGKVLIAEEREAAQPDAD